MQTLTFNSISLLCVTSLVLALGLTGCSGDYAVNSNLSKRNWDDYFKASGIEVLSREQLAGMSYTTVGLVHGESCQENVELPPPDMAQAQTVAKRKAADLGANGLRALRCVHDSQPIPGCLASISCYGEAIALSDEQIKQLRAQTDNRR